MKTLLVAVMLLFLGVSIRSSLPDHSVGQLLMVGLSQTKLSKEHKSLIVNEKIGGIVLVGRNWSDKHVYDISREIQQLRPDNPVLIAIDHEGGRVNRFDTSVQAFPSARHMSLDNNENKCFHYGYVVGQTLKGLGIHMNLSPVLDVDLETSNPVINDRSFGTDPNTVTTLGLSYMNGLRQAEILPAVKHYPGHGRTTTDSHVTLPTLTTPKEILENTDMIPFKQAVVEGVPVIMTAHVVYSDIDSQYPATLSKTHLTHNLRQKYGFNGVIISDDLSMAAITSKWSLQTASVKALNAGVDMLLVTAPPKTIQELIDHLDMAIISGALDKQEMQLHFERVRTLRKLI